MTLEGDKLCLNCGHFQKQHNWSTDGFCMAEGCKCGELKTVDAHFDKDLEMVILNLQKHFERLPTDREVYRFIFGTPEERERIYENKGMPPGWA